MHVRLPSTLTLLTMGPFMQLASAAEAWSALTLGGLLLAASCIGRDPRPQLIPEPLPEVDVEPEPEPDLMMNRLPEGRPRPKFRSYASELWERRVPQPAAAVPEDGRRYWGHVEDWFQ